MKIWLDDLLDDPESPERHTPPGWVGVKTAWDAIEYLKTGDVTEIDLDHDLGNDELLGTGYTVVKWIEEQVYFTSFVPPVMKIHSANPEGVRKMRDGIDSINRIYEKKLH
jgi:hypothetical protein